MSACYKMASSKNITFTREDFSIHVEQSWAIHGEESSQILLVKS